LFAVDFSDKKVKPTPRLSPFLPLWEEEEEKQESIAPWLKTYSK
jgi:hypothetical protein